MKVSKNFDIREFVPQALWDDKKKASLWYVSPIVIQLAQFYKDFFSDYFGEEVTVTINDWLWGGVYHNRGYRFPMTEVGSPLSFHRGGMCTAFDCEIRVKSTGQEIDPNRIREIILENEKLFMEQGLTTLESGRFAPGWIHSDHRNTGLDTILIVGDKRK